MGKKQSDYNQNAGSESASQFPEVNAYLGWFPAPCWRQSWQAAPSHHSYSSRKGNLSTEAGWEMQPALNWAIRNRDWGKSPKVPPSCCSDAVLENLGDLLLRTLKKIIILAAVTSSVTQYKPLQLSLVFVPHHWTRMMMPSYQSERLISVHLAAGPVCQLCKLGKVSRFVYSKKFCICCSPQPGAQLCHKKMHLKTLSYTVVILNELPNMKQAMHPWRYWKDV